ncbi:hypothetical protein SUGI_0536370 [Cryptomeria japonica]|nr:hypothetical protein SUGI_0536370 [Cryptomeria japonica]
MVRRSILVKTCFMYLAFAMVFLEKKCQSVEIVRGDTLPLGASLAGKETLISKNGAFALGFFSPNGTNNWYIGIWFSQIPEKTVVWVANRETPVLSTPSVLNFSRDGRLRLFDSNGRSIWSSNNSLRASRAVMMENGNFIMLGAQNGSEIVWESFRYPGDTLLPGMKMWKGMKLTSWKNSVDPALGPFSFGMDTSPGRTQFLLLSSSDLYWSTGEWINGQFKNMPYHSFQQKFTGLDCKTLSPTQIYCLLIPSGEIMSRVVMAENGVIGRYFLEDNGGWTLIGFTPRDQCNVYNVCGAYAACNAYARSNGYSTSNSHDACRCLDGFRPRDIRAWDSQQWWSSGCVRRRRLQCSASNGTTDGFREVKSTYLADNQAVSFTTTQTLQGCRLECLGNCSCMAFLVTNSTIPICRMWFGDLLNVRETSDGQTVFIRVAASELEDRSESKWGRSHKSIMLRVFLPVTAGALALAFALLLAWIILRKQWISGLPITPKADVYSFGMTLLEIISGRRNVDLTVQKSSTYYFPPWAATQVHKGNLMAVVDERISQETDGEQVRRAVMTSMLCIQEDENARPSMAQVVQLLEGITEANAQQIQGSVEMLRDHEREEEDSDTSV